MKVAIWCALVSLALLAQGDDKPLPVLKDVLIGNQFFQIEVAHTPQTRQHGLMDRDELGFDVGMLFVFPVEEERVFWMCRTRIDLDIVFLSAAGVVVDIQTMAAEVPRKPGETETDYEARLPRYPGKAPAQFAIELQAGTAAAVGLRDGDRVPLDIPYLNRLVASEVGEAE